MLENTFEYLLTRTQGELLVELPEYLKAKGYTEIVEKDYAIGFKSPKTNQPAVVAHLDTINTKGRSYIKRQPGSVLDNNEEERTPTKEDILFTEKYILLSPEANHKIVCLGGDDRVGVKTILDLVDSGNMPHLLFTTNEESGCLGSNELIGQKDFDFLKEATMLIQVDRGVHEDSWHEMVFYSFDTSKAPSILEELKKYYDLATGSYTDVAVLGPHFNKPIVNLSASYENEHTRNEFINLKAYEYNTESLNSFLAWACSQDCSEWKWHEKPMSYGSLYYGSTGTIEPSYRWDSKRELPKDFVMGELVNGMYKYANKDPKINYSWNFFKSQAQIDGMDYLIQYAEFCIVECYKAGLFMENFQALSDLFNGEIYEEYLESLEKAEEYSDSFGWDEE